MIHVASIFLILILAVGGTASAQSQSQTAPQPQAPPPTCDGPEYRQFDFWVGDWDVEVKGVPADRPKPRSRIERILKDCVILENWMPPNGMEGKSFNLYNRRTKNWEQTWVDSTGGVIHFSGGIRDGNMLFTSEFTNRNGQKVQGRMTYIPQGPDRLRQVWEQSTDEGKTWTVLFDGIYVRRKQ